MVDVERKVAQDTQAAHAPRLVEAARLEPCVVGLEAKLEAPGVGGAVQAVASVARGGTRGRVAVRVDGAEVAEQLSITATAVCGYEVVVVAEPVGPAVVD